MVKFHYHKIGNSQYCHVYSDKPGIKGLKELREWGRKHGIPISWIQHGTLIHFDLWGSKLRLCGPGVEREEVASDIRRLRHV